MIWWLLNCLHMPDIQYFIDQIELELAAARAAAEAGNDGKVRVCARRAAGKALSWYLSRHHHPDWGTDAVRQLLHAAEDQDFPQEARVAAQRLTTKISDRFKYPFSTDPIEDARIIIETVIRRMKSDAS